MKRFSISFCFLLSVVSTQQQQNENDIIQTPIVGVELTEAGLHRNLIYTVQFDYPLAGKECEYVLRQHLPASVYVSVDQLDDLQRLKKLDAFYPSFVDIEKPTEQSNDFEVYLKGVPKITDTLTLPIHFRYHAPKEESLFAIVDINTPTMFINCPKHEEHLLENELQIEANTLYCLDEKVPKIKKSDNNEVTGRWNEACNWKYVKVDVKLKSALRAEIPVGNERAFPPILYATIIVSWIVSLWTIFRTRRVPMAINQKLEEQRILQKKYK
ncbi:phosphatidylinositol glycan anchor biosynthesis class X [Cochliomyia hominivorax]